jgi:hypothetical protein
MLETEVAREVAAMAAVVVQVDTRAPEAQAV